MSNPGSEAGWLELLEDLIQKGQCFLAYDLAGQARAAYPNSQRLSLLAVLAMMRGGAVQEAHKLLAELGPGVGRDPHLAEQILETLRARLPVLLQPGNGRLDDSLDWIANLAEQIQRLASQTRTAVNQDRDSLRLMAQVHQEVWRQQGRAEDLRDSRDAHLQAFLRFQDLETGINAARQTWLLGDRDQAQAIAQQILQSCRARITGPETARDAFRHAVTLAESLLLTGAPDQAEAVYLEVKHQFSAHYAWLVEARSRLLPLVQHGFSAATGCLELIEPPVVLIGAGQPLDGPDGTAPRFPAGCEDPVRRAIQDQLDQLGVHIGYSSAGAGTDILFVEALLERDAEVHLVLPCAIEDFVQERVAYAGPRWERRFRRAIKLASSLTFATEEAYLGHQWLYRFNNQIIDGLARLRANLLGTEPYLLLVWDYGAGNAAGTAADFMDHWPDIARLRLIELDELRAAHPETLTDRLPVQATSPGLRREPQRVPKTLLFADIQGFSKIKEEDLPGLWTYLAEVRRRLESHCGAPDLVESWGDALYVVMNDARGLLQYAFHLQDSFHTLDPAAYGLPISLGLRVALHAGPVYAGIHPLTQRPIVYGNHVSRTARIEPITVPGHIYASQQFVALLTAEESAYRTDQGLDTPPWYACEYVGVVQLAKNYGDAPVYHLVPKAPFP